MSAPVSPQTAAGKALLPVRRLAARLAARLQFLLPRFWLTALVYRAARIRRPAVKNFLIRRIVSRYGIATDELARSVPDDFASLNDFFTRELAVEARPVASGADAVVSPVDGIVSEAGDIAAGRLLQAKGIDYSLDDLLMTDLDRARDYADGRFATLYLAPHNYHRVHAPVDGELCSMLYVPGELFSVNAATTSTVRGLFRRNERLIMHFRTDHGPAVLIFVGALNVGSLSTPWTGEIRPRKRGVVEALATKTLPEKVRRGDLLGWFNLGSTVILLFPRGACHWSTALRSGAAVRMGELIGSRTATAG